MAGMRSACEVVAVSRKFCKGASTPSLQAALSLQAGVVTSAGGLVQIAGRCAAALDRAAYALIGVRNKAVPTRKQIEPCPFTSASLGAR